MDSMTPTPAPLSPARAARRERILETARCLIGRLGFTRVSMQDIAEGAKVTRKTLYDIYGSKDNLLAQAMVGRMQRLLEQIAESTKGPPLPRLFSIISKTIDAVLEVPELSRAVEPILLLNPGRFSIIDYFNELHRSCLEELRSEGKIEDWGTDDFLLKSMMSDQIAVQNYWANGLISDQQLKNFALLSLCRVLLPVAHGSLREELISHLRKYHEALDSWTWPAPAPQPKAQAS